MDAVKNLEGHYHRNVITTFSFKDHGPLKLLELECASKDVWFYYFLFYRIYILIFLDFTKIFKWTS